LRDLIENILAHSSAPRLRLSSLEPWDLDDQFFSLWKDPRLCRHLHLPLQSGCAATLRRMARKITPESFTALVESARRQIPGVAITTDVITGFPGETGQEFDESLAFIESMEFAGGHVFTYSAREGTAASRMPSQVPVSVRKERNARVRAALLASADRYRHFFVGQELPVLWESITGSGPDGWQVSGLTGNYLRITATATDNLWNTITPVRLERVTSDGLDGRILTGDNHAS
jgi:threonylcarbamoyladenosine tRNA methylthiotransferase MtaB